jgi:hypothetical protein
MIIHPLEFHSLVAALVPFSQHMLRNHDGFLPLGAIFRSGDVVMVAPESEHPIATGREWLQLIIDGLRSHAAEPACDAIAYCVDVKLTDTRNGQVIDAAQVVFEHRRGESLHAFFPYKKTGDAYEFAMPMLRIAARQFFESDVRPYVN